MLLLALLFSTNLENAISTEADHGLIVSSGAEKMPTKTPQMISACQTRFTMRGCYHGAGVGM
jgi:hypothetical protein